MIEAGVVLGIVGMIFCLLFLGLLAAMTGLSFRTIKHMSAMSAGTRENERIEAEIAAAIAAVFVHSRS